MILLKLLRFWLPVVLYAGLIFWASSQPSVEAPAVIPHLDKLIHLVEYAVLGWLLARALIHASRIPNRGAIKALVICLVVLYGMSDEYHQSFVVGRSSEWLDLLADSVGGTLGGWIYITLNNKD